jgi:ParB/RepB/Spo0J family partition protein
MSKRAGGWKRQSYQDAEAEIRQSLGLNVQPTDELRQLADDQIEDSPYQARAGYDEAQLAELAAGMGEAGFQGVLFARPHPGGPAGGRERFQLVYGHRRRLAWRRLCAERGQPCLLPVVVRPFSDRQLLTIGAQENLQRQDLSPVEEAQLVSWHQELYYPAGLAEIGRMLGKSEDWAKTRSRVAQLPEPLRELVRRSPHLMTGVLELSRLWAAAPAEALALAERAEREGLTLRELRPLIAERETKDREKKNERRVDTPSVQSITSDGPETALGAATDPVRQIDATTERILAQLSGWSRPGRSAAERAAISRGCERVLLQIQRLIDQLAEPAGPDDPRD